VKRILRIAALILAGEMIFSLPFHTQRFFRSSMLDAFGISNTQLGDMFAVYGITAMFSYFAGGPLADRYPARALMSLSLVLTAAGGIYMATFPGVWQMGALYGYWGVTTTFLFWAALIKATRDWGGDAAQGVAFGVLEGGRGLATAVFGMVAVSILVAYLPTEVAAATDEDRRAGLAAIILYFSAITLLCAAVVWILVPHDERTVSAHRSPYAGVREVIRRPLVWAQACIIICAYCGYKGLDNAQLYAVQALGMNEIDASRLATWAVYLRPVACIAAGLVADRFDSARSILGLFVVLVAAYAVLALRTPDPAANTLILGSLLVTFLAVFALRAIYYVLLEETHTPKHLTGASVAVIAFVGYAPEAFFGPVTGRILDADPGVGGHMNFYAFLVATAVAGILVTLWLVRLNRRSVRG
jgi:sugar phosphate permease